MSNNKKELSTVVFQLNNVWYVKVEDTMIGTKRIYVFQSEYDAINFANMLELKHLE